MPLDLLSVGVFSGYWIEGNLPNFPSKRFPATAAIIHQFLKF